MKFTRYDEPGANDGFGPMGGRTQYQAIDDGRIKGTAEVSHAFTTSSTSYPTHPTRRGGGGFRNVRTTRPDYMRRPTINMSGPRPGSPLPPSDDPNDHLAGYDEGWQTLNSVAVGEQTPLFAHKSQRHSAKVDYLRTTPGAKALVGPLLGIAGRDQLAQGEALTPSDDLSKHSGAMVAHLNKSLGTQFSSDKKNDLTFERGSSSLGTPDWDADEIPRGEVDAGRKMFRRTLRSGRPVRDAGYEQMSIFDAPE